MSENASVIVIPSIYSQNKINNLISNIKKILKIKEQSFSKILKDDSVIVVEAADPVFTSSAINLLFGIKKVAIAKKVKNEYESLVESISKIGSNLLLAGDRYVVRVEGDSSGFLPKDLEIAATSSIIENTTDLGAQPGTEQNYNKEIYTYLTKSNAYVCIFTDKGLGGVPYNSQQEKILCCIFDELSSISCLETIKQGFDVKLIVCYTSEPELLKLTKILNRLLPRTLNSKINLEFYKIKKSKKNPKDFVDFQKIVTDMLIDIAKSNKIKKISLSLTPLIFPSEIIDNLTQNTFKKNLIPYVPLSGIDEGILNNAKEIGLGKFLPNLEKFSKMNFSNSKSQTDIKKFVNESLKSKKEITVTIGPNNIHDILDSLKSNN